jgi:RNA polymerase sigma factor (sigma-70 family)
MRAEERPEDYVPALRRYVRRLTGRRLRLRESVSDLVQSVLRMTLGYRGPKAPAPSADRLPELVALLARRKIQDKGRYYSAECRGDDARAVAVERLDNAPSSSPSPSEAVATADLLRLVAAAADRLSPSQRQAFQLVRIEGLSHAEAADHMGVTEGACRVAFHRAAARLARILTDD